MCVRKVCERVGFVSEWKWWMGNWGSSSRGIPVEISGFKSHFCLNYLFRVAAGIPNWSWRIIPKCWLRKLAPKIQSEAPPHYSLGSINNSAHTFFTCSAQFTLTHFSSCNNPFHLHSHTLNTSNENPQKQSTTQFSRTGRQSRGLPLCALDTRDIREWFAINLPSIKGFVTRRITRKHGANTTRT